MTAVPVDVRRLLRRVARTLAWGQAWAGAVRGVTIAAAASLAWALLGTVIPLSLPPLLVLAAGLAAALLLALARGVLPVRDLAPAARVADAELRLRERVSTALDLATGRIPATALADQVLRDAAATARDALPGARLRPTWPGGTRRALLVVSLAALASVLVPGFSLPATPARETAVRIKREGRRLEQVAKQLEQLARTERAPQARRTAPEVRSLARELQRERMDRSAALARIAALERQLEAARRQLSQRIGEALNPQAPAQIPESLFRPTTTLDQNIRQLRELAARLSQEQNVEGQRDDLLAQLAQLSQSGEGQLPIEARRKLEEARRKTEAGDTAGGREALTEAIQELEGLRAVLADENALRITERELERSSMRIARGAGPESAEEVERGETRTAPPGPGTKRLQEQEGEAVGAPPPQPGPNEGSTPGQGKIAEKLGPQSPRLDAEAQRSRVRGQEGQGQLQTTELLGPGRKQPARAPAVNVSPLVVRRADEHMARARIPADLRAVVRRYFLALAQRR